MAKERLEKVNKAKAERDLYFAMMGEEPCCDSVEVTDKADLIDQCDEALWVYEDMLSHAIDSNDQEDIRSLRRRVQEIKIEKRRLLAS